MAAGTAAGHRILEIFKALIDLLFWESMKKDKTSAKRAALVERTAKALNCDEKQAEKLLSLERRQSVRVNTLKAHTHVLEELMALGWSGKQFAWFKNGYTVETGLREIRDSELVASGQVYIQNAASWLPVLALDPQPGQEILDMCAAPGGKTSHIAAYANNEAHITANDNSRPRLAKLQANLGRMNVQNVEYTLFDATQLSRKLPGRLFDKILLDAPCSGEGMMNLARDKDFDTWSVAQIKRLHHLQKKLIVQAWQLLKPGGTLVYSTCTLAPEENEAVVDYLLRHNDDVMVGPLDFALANRAEPVLVWNNRSFSSGVSKALRLKPSPNVEAFFVIKLKKLP